MSFISGRRNKTTSSAYNDILCWRDLEESGYNKPSLTANDTIWPSTSITKMKSIGESGSPCRNPRRCKITSPGIPFNRTRVDEEPNSPLIISRQICPKPNCCITSRRKGQDTESNAFEISSLRRKRGSFC